MPVKRKRKTRKNPLSRKYYIRFADDIASAYNTTAVSSEAELRGAKKLYRNVISKISASLKADNSRFDATRFEEYIKKQTR